MSDYVYIIHFDEPISPDHTCQHYAGYADDLWFRARMHLGGKGARLTQVAKERGIGMRVVRAFYGTRDDERRLKNQKNTPKYCPVCNPDASAPGWMKELSINELEELLP